jgi:amidase
VRALGGVDRPVGRDGDAVRPVGGGDLRHGAARVDPNDAVVAVVGGVDRDEESECEQRHAPLLHRLGRGGSSYASLESVTLAFLPALEQARLIREGELSPVELVQHYLDRIERLDPELNAYVTVCAEQALAEASSPRPGPFSGVPLPVKDLTETAGIRTTFSCKAFADYVPAEDVEVVRRIRAAGFVLLGKTNTPEFGSTAVTESELNGICRNPWDRSRTPGGSSGGSAAAVAAGLAPLAHGTDGGGSIRIPASCCGVFGLKPSRGRVSPAPRGDVYGFSASGPLSRTVADAAAFLDAVAGSVPGDPYAAAPPERPFLEEAGRPPGRLRIGLALDPPHPAEVDPACSAAAEEAAGLLAELGHEVEAAAQPPASDELMTLFAIVWQTIPMLYPLDDHSLLEPLNAAFVAGAKGGSSANYVRAFAGLQLYARALAEAWAQYDVVLTPTLAQPPVPVGWVFAADDPWEQFRRAADFTPFTPPVNVAGLPAASVPFAWTDGGLPIGVHLIGPAGGEALLFRLAAQLEEARPWADRRPPLSD